MSNTSTPIPELHKEDLIELNGTFSEDIDFNDMESINENILLDLAVKKGKLCTENYELQESCKSTEQCRSDHEFNDTMSAVKIGKKNLSRCRWCKAVTHYIQHPK